jgi:hypothetical protein
MDKLFDFNKLESKPKESYYEVPNQEHRGGWEPYVNNEGTVVGKKKKK